MILWKDRRHKKLINHLPAATPIIRSEFSIGRKLNTWIDKKNIKDVFSKKKRLNLKIG